MNYVPLNFSLMSSPYNWVLVFLVVALASKAIQLLTHDNIPTP